MTDKTEVSEIIARVVYGEHTYYMDTLVAKDVAASILTALKDAGYVIEPEWRPIEEAPKDGTRVLLFVPPYGPSTGHYEPARANWGPKASLWIAHSVLNKEAEPTHYRPLPSPPEGE